MDPPPPDLPVPPEPNPGPDRRARYLAIAVESIREAGPAVGMEAIAARAGVTKPAVYRVFGSKRGLYQAVADWFIGEILADIDALITDQLPLEAFIAGTVDHVLDLIEHDVAVYQFLMRRARMELSSGGVHEQKDFLHQLGDAVTARMVIRLEAVGLDAGPAPVISHGVIGMINGVADWWITQPDIDRTAVVAIVTSVLWQGFAPFDVQ